MKRKSVLLLSTLVTAALLLVALLVAFSLTAGRTLAAPPGAPEPTRLRVYGTIAADTVWTEAGSPYVVTDTLTVSEGVTLTIEPGVVVKFDAARSLIVHGKLYAPGTPVKPILFTSNASTTPAANDWGEIRLEEASPTSTLSYCQIEYATHGLVLTDTADGNQISNSVFRYNGGAIHSLGSAWETSFTDNVLAYNGYGFLFEGSNLYTTLTGNAIHDNTQWGIKTDNLYNGWSSSFLHNAIYDNGGPGILFEAGSFNLPTVRSNAFYGNGGYQLENRSTEGFSAEGNWWGTNAPAAGTTFTGTIAYSPPIQLSVSRSPVSIPANGASTSVVSALMTDGSGRYPPDGTYVSFTTTMGSVVSRLTEVESGAVGKGGDFVDPRYPVPGASGGYLRWSNQPGDTVTYTFTGDSIVYVYALGDNCGYANVSVDGTPYPSIDMYSLTSFTPQVERVIATGLGPGTHTITVSVAGISNPHSSNVYVYADAFKVGSGDGLVTTTLTSGTGTGTATVTATAPGPASVATTVGFAPLGPSSVTLTRSPTSVPADGVSTSTISATVKDELGNDVPDGTVVTFTTSLGTFPGGPTTPSPTGVYIAEVEGPFVNRIGMWLSYGDINASNGGGSYSNNVGDRVSYAFTGTRASVLFQKQWNAGIAEVRIDGVLYRVVDTYYDDPANPGTGKLYQQEEVIADGLPYRSHTMEVIVTGQKNDLAIDAFLVLDAFKVYGVNQNGARLTTGGVATVTVSSNVTGTATITGTSDSASGTTTVDFVSAVYSLIVTADPTTITADGASTSTITATLTPPMQGVPIYFGSTLGSISHFWTEGESPPVERTVEFLDLHPDPNASGGVLLWSDEYLDQVVYTFSGTAITLTHATGSNCGFADVSIDGVSYPSIDMYSSGPVVYQVNRLITDTLPPGTHTITVAVSGSKVVSSTGSYVYVDAFNGIPAFTDVGGIAVATLTAGTTPGVATVSAWTAGLGITASGQTTVNLILGPGLPATVSLEASPATLPVNDTARLTATVLDQYADPLPGQVITFSTSSGDLGSGGIGPLTATTNASGQAVSYISSTITGIKLVVATAPNLVAGTTTVTFTAASGCEDDYEPDNSLESATTVTPPSTTHHNFDTANDLDWVRFRGLAGITYTIETVNLAVSGDQQVDTKISFYYESDAVRFAYDDDGGEPLYGSKIVWPVTTTGWYYVNVGQVIARWSFTGCNTYYDLRISGPPTGVYLPIILKNYPPAPTPVCCPVWEATVGVEDGPRGIAINTATNRIYVANHDDDTISIIDGGTNVVVGTIDLAAYGHGPSGIAYHPSGFLYVSLGHSDKVAIINASTEVVERTVDVGAEPAGVAVNPVTGRVYVANFGCDSVSVISGSTVVRVIPVEDEPSQIAVNPATNRIFVTNHGADYVAGSSVSVIDGNTDTVIKTIKLVTGDPPTPGQGPYGIAVNPNTNKIYVAVIDSRHLVVIDDNNLDAQPTYIAPPLNLMLWMVAVNPDLNRVYAVGYNEYGTNKLFVLDGATNAWLPCDLDVGSYPE